MTAPLAGLSVLVIEDDFYLADDAQQTLEAAGAKVLGPVSNAADALELLARTHPDCALVDVNLGGGANFVSAEALQQQGVPFVFLTGYDASIVPPRFASIPRLEKPVRKSDMLAALGDITATGGLSNAQPR
jgi:CheY-like chemotaxis protein